ncbi:MAG: ATP-binding cassette domain-containing protein [Actinobacteria bacterium]|nr:ATP-binding cassette domain-containing protein [Actinomycetota bacterium]
MSAHQIAQPLIEVDHAVRRYRATGAAAANGRWNTVLDDVCLRLEQGSTTALVGSSGAGKTTLVRCLLALDHLDHGTVACRGRSLRPGPARSLGWFRRMVQYVPQDPASSLDPRRRVRELIAEPLRRLGVEGDHPAMVAEALDHVGLGQGLADRRPGEISGGQAQRVAIARAIVTRPELLVADEPVSGLDLPLRQQVLDLLARLHRDDGTGILLVSHDLAAVVRLCDRTVVMEHGQVAEDGPTERMFTDPSHPATRRLLAAVPRLPRPA